MSLNEQTISFVFFFTMQFYQYRLPDETKKIPPRTENYPPPPPPHPAAQRNDSKP